MPSFLLSYEGEDTDGHVIDFYDAAQALVGFQRSLAITTHLVLNGEVIVQAPSLKRAKIFAHAVDAGSWKILSSIVFAGTVLHGITTASPETVLGHIVRSAYDYVVAETLGFHVDFDKTLGQQYEELHKRGEGSLPSLREQQLDSVIEKCENALIQMHRPIVNSKTAAVGYISAISGDLKTPSHELSQSTYDYVLYTDKSSTSELIVGQISSYNINTYKGRIYIAEEKRPVPFFLSDNSRNSRNIGLITESLTMNAQEGSKTNSFLRCHVYKNYSRTGRLKSVLIADIDRM